MLHLYQPGGFMGYAAVDQASEAVWYWRTADFSFGMARRSNGDFVMWTRDSASSKCHPTPGSFTRCRRIDGLARWHLLVRTATMFRAEPFDAIGGEALVKR